MSDLRERLRNQLRKGFEATNGGLRAISSGRFTTGDSGVNADKYLQLVWPIIEAELQKRDQEVTEAVEFERAIVSALSEQVREGDRRAARWISRAIKAEDDLTEASKLLEQCIDVLEGFVKQTHSTNDYRCPICGGVWDYPDEHHTEYCPYPQAKPLLDNLKAHKKEAGNGG